MKFEEYQVFAEVSSVMRGRRGMARLTMAGLGLAGEAGEVTDLIEKYVGHGQPLDEEKLIEEIGDVLWYVAEVCNSQGLELEAVARRNIEKLRERYPQGGPHPPAPSPNLGEGEEDPPPQPSSLKGGGGEGEEFPAIAFFEPPASGDHDHSMAGLPQGRVRIE